MTSQACPVRPTVTANNGTTFVSMSGNIYEPTTPEQYTYDPDGNLASDGRWKYTWDAENRLIAMETIASAPVEARKKMTFAYDYMSRRVLKRTHDWDTSSSAWSAGFMHKYYYDGWNLIGEVDETGLVKSYLWGTDLSGTAQGAGGVGGLLKIEDWYTWPGSANPARHESYAISDANGNVMKLVDAQTLTTVADYEYGPFGELIRMTGDRAKANPFRFSSKYQDDESGLLYYGYRYYDAEVGRWISRDPIEHIRWINKENTEQFVSIGHKELQEELIQLYAMVSNDTINWTDMLGLLNYVKCEDSGLPLPTAGELRQHADNILFHGRVKKCILSRIDDVQVTCRSRQQGICNTDPPPLAYAAANIPILSWFFPSTRISLCCGNLKAQGCGENDIKNIMVHEIAHLCGMPAETQWEGNVMPEDYRNANVPGMDGGYKCTGR